MDKNHPKFDQFPVSQLPAATHYGFHNDFADIVAPLEASFPNLTPLLQAYRAALQVESRIYVRPRGLNSTRKLLEADLRRDRLLGVILQTVNAHRANPLEPRRRAAQTRRRNRRPACVRSGRYRRQGRQLRTARQDSAEFLYPRPAAEA